MSTKASDIYTIASGQDSAHANAAVDVEADGGTTVPRDNILALRLRQLIELRGMNPREVSRDAGLTGTYCYDVINQRNLNPSILHIQAIARVLGTTLDYLMGAADDVGNPLPYPRLDTMPLFGTVEAGTYRKLSPSDPDAFPMVYGPRSKSHPVAQHFALQIADDSMNARVNGPSLTPGMTACCVDMVDAGLVVESDRLYALRRSVDGGRTFETIMRRARVFRHRTELVAESTNPDHDAIVIEGAVPVGAENDGVYAIGLIYAVLLSLE